MHRDYLIAQPADFGWQQRPPLNYDGGASLVYAIIVIAASAASTAISVDSSNKAAEQSQMNAQSQNLAIKSEQDRRAAEDAENQRRAVMDQKRFRAQQFSKLAATGQQLGTGSALAIEADTWAASQLALADQNYKNQLEQRELAYRRTSALEMGAQQSRFYKNQATGSLISGISNTVSIGAGYA